MARLGAFVVLATCAWTVASASAETGARLLGPSICGSGTEFTIVFWPHGHHAFGNDTVSVVVPEPHFELYAGGHKTEYSPADFLGSAFALESGRGSAGSFLRTCRAFAPKFSSAAQAAKSITDATALVCTLRSPPVHQAVGLVSDDAALFGVAYSLSQRPNLTVVSIRLWLNRSRLSYDSSFCHPTATPR
jgi:hypothetical protein